MSFVCCSGKASISTCKTLPYLQPGPSSQGCQTPPNKVANIYAVASCCVVSGGGAAGPKAPVNQHNPHIASISPKTCLVVVLPGLDELGTPFPSFAGYRVRLGPVLEPMCEDLQRGLFLGTPSGSWFSCLWFPLGLLIHLSKMLH